MHQFVDRAAERARVASSVVMSAKQDSGFG